MNRPRAIILSYVALIISLFVSYTLINGFHGMWQFKMALLWTGKVLLAPLVSAVILSAAIKKLNFIIALVWFNIIIAIVWLAFIYYLSKFIYK